MTIEQAGIIAEIVVELEGFSEDELALFAERFSKHGSGFQFSPLPVGVPDIGVEADQRATDTATDNVLVVGRIVRNHELDGATVGAFGFDFYDHCELRKRDRRHMSAKESI